MSIYKETPKKELRIYHRFSDNVTFISLIIGVFISFIVSLGIYAYEFMQTATFWTDAAKCIAEQDFSCIMSIRTEETIIKDLLLTVLGASLGFQGLIFGFLTVTLYKSYNFQEK